VSAYAEVTITCDAHGCPHTFVTEWNTEYNARRDAHHHGWTHTGDDRDHCPEHSASA
jgi:hypothetical protein